MSPANLMLLVSMIVMMVDGNQTQIAPRIEISETEEPVRNRTFGAIAKAKCAEYAKFVYQEVFPFSLTRSRRQVKIPICANGQNKIVDGSAKAQPFEFPHMVALGYNTNTLNVQWLSTGVLVSDRYVLSAAHYTVIFSPGPPRKVRLGDPNLFEITNIAKPQERYIVRTEWAGKDFHPLGYDDIALLKLDRPVDLNPFIRPACLPYSSPDVSSPEEKAVATGFRRLRINRDAERIQDFLKATVNFVDGDSCNRSYTDGGVHPRLPRGILPESQLCVTYHGNDTCEIDEEGALLVWNQDHECVYTVLGVQSARTYCNDIAPAIFTRVSHYMDWMEDIIWPEGI